MPHRRPAKKGSFSGHFDQLVEHFDDEAQPKLNGDTRKSKRQRKQSVHQMLFETSTH